jgi:hypothetical protein
MFRNHSILLISLHAITRRTSGNKNQSNIRKMNIERREKNKNKRKNEGKKGFLRTKKLSRFRIGCVLMVAKRIFRF